MKQKGCGVFRTLHQSSKGKIVPAHVIKAYEGMEVQLHTFLILTLDGVLSFMTWPLHPQGKSLHYLLKRRPCGP